jgi:rapamycin-insensitive companion of mTOR
MGPPTPQKEAQSVAASMATMAPPPLAGRPSFDRDALQLPPTANGAGASMRNLSWASSVTFAPRGSSLNPSPAPGSFSAELRSRAGSRPELYGAHSSTSGGGGAQSGSGLASSAGGALLLDAGEDGDEEGPAAAARELAVLQLREELTREMKYKEGSENMLEALNGKKGTGKQRAKVEEALNASNAKIKELRAKISEAQRVRAGSGASITGLNSGAGGAGAAGGQGGGGGFPAQLLQQGPSTPTRQKQQDSMFQHAMSVPPSSASTITPGGLGGFGPGSGILRSPPSASRSGAGSELEEPTESPTFVLAEILQALELQGMTAEYYVTKANSLVDLFKRHTNLKYDLVWSVFGLRMQVMLLSDRREVVAAAYRMVRYAISDVSSLRKIRAFNTDYVVML